MSSETDAALEAFIESKIPKHLRPNYDRDISMIKAGWFAALECFRKASSKWQRKTPDQTAIWWWWNEAEDSSPIPVNITLRGSTGNYFAMAGQYGWNRAQDVSEMGGLWMLCLEPAIPDFDERERLILEDVKG